MSKQRNIFMSYLKTQKKNTRDKAGGGKFEEEKYNGESE